MTFGMALFMLLVHQDWADKKETGMRTWPRINEVLGSRNRGAPAESGLCVQCRIDCRGKCETFLSCLKGKAAVYPADHGKVIFASDNTNPIGVSYNALRIQGAQFGSTGLREGLTREAKHCLPPNVDFAAQFGSESKTALKVPIKAGAYGTAPFVGKYWDSYAVGAALVGFALVIGENVMNMDKGMVIEKGRVAKAPEIDRRIESFMKYYDGRGALAVQVNYDDMYNGPTVDYICEKYGDKVILEIKWGQGAKPINGEAFTKDLEHALFLSRRYPVFPDPRDEEVQKAYAEGKVRSFTRQSVVPFTEANSCEQVRAEFVEAVKNIRHKGCRRIALKTGGFNMPGLALAIKLATEAKLDLLTIDGSGGGTALSPWNMMEHWGTPSILAHAKAWEYANALAAQGEKVVDLSFAGGFAREDHLFKALALGAPFAKVVSLGRAMMIPGFVGANIEGVLKPEKKDSVFGNWQELPAAVREIGKSPEELFAAYYDVRNKVGASEMDSIPYGAIAIWTYVDKLMKGLQQLMAGARKYSLQALTREDVAALNRETANETGIAYITEAQNALAMKILSSK